MAVELCRICTLDEAAHGALHHKFSRDGQLVAKPLEPKADPRVNAEHQIRVAAEQTTAARLAAILHTRGLIDDADLVYVLTGGSNGSIVAARQSTG